MSVSSDCITWNLQAENELKLIIDESKLIAYRMSWIDGISLIKSDYTYEL